MDGLATSTNRVRVRMEINRCYIQLTVYACLVTCALIAFGYLLYQLFLIVQRYRELKRQAT